MGGIWDGLKGFWHDLWAPSPEQPHAAPPAPSAPAQGPAPADLAGGHDANYWRQMSAGACPTNVPIIPHPSASDAQAEYLACMAGSPIGINIAPPAPTPYGDSFNP